VTLVVDGSCPAEVTLDPMRAKQAIQYALTNAASAAREGGPVRVIVRGGTDRWITELAVDRPPPPTVQPLTLRPDLCERLCGIEAERRGMDLAIAAKISAMFGGTARLEVREGRGTSVVLDWPTRLSPTA
jgi:signal transduction histidine kinase